MAITITRRASRLHPLAEDALRGVLFVCGFDHDEASTIAATVAEHRGPVLVPSLHDDGRALRDAAQACGLMRFVAVHDGASL